MLIIRWKMVCEILFYTIIKSTCFKKKYSRRHSYIIFIYHINPFNCYLKMRQPKYITELAKNTNIDKKKKKDMPCATSLITDGTGKDSNGQQYSPIPTQKCIRRHAGDEGTDVHHFTVFSISVSATFQLKKQGGEWWRKGKKRRGRGREERREEGREGGYQRPSEAHCRANLLDFFTHLGCSLTCPLHTLTFLLPTAKKEEGKN